MSFDVLQLVDILRRSWDALDGSTGLSLRDLDEAETLANRLVTEVGIRERPQPLPSADLRQRAFTLMATTYDHARRLIAFLRWNEGDADRIAPPITRGGRGRPRSRAAQTEKTGAGNASSDAPTRPTNG